MENLFVVISVLENSCEGIQEFYRNSGEVHHFVEK